ncbi:MAG: hypothetical protein ABW221_21400 [Vicinamibacteria bacterium]
MRTTMAAALVAGLAALPARGADDDLTVVRRAVEDHRASRPAGARGAARWFRVRIEERDGSKVKVNLPLPFVRALGEKADGWPGGIRCGRNGGGVCRMQLSDVLGALDAGQELVTLDDADSRIRIWID